MVAKISWIQVHRDSEQFIIELANTRAALPDTPRDDRIAIIGHIPEVIAHTEYEDYDTDKIREKLGLETKPGSALRCRIIISRRLYHITELDDYTTFLEAFWETVLCEFFFSCHLCMSTDPLQRKVIVLCGHSAFVTETSAKAI